MSKSKTNDIFGLFNKGLNTLLKVRRELRASRSEARAIKRETRAEENHERKQQTYFGRPLPKENSSGE